MPHGGAVNMSLALGFQLRPPKLAGYAISVTTRMKWVLGYFGYFKE